MVDPPYFGWFSSQLPVYPEDTLLLKTLVHFRSVDALPELELEPTEHPLAVQQRDGISQEQVHRFSEVLHPADDKKP